MVSDYAGIEMTFEEYFSFTLKKIAINNLYVCL